jgi:putative GTP pyrophosphokinase
MNELDDNEKYDSIVLKYEYAKRILEADIDVLFSDYEHKNNRTPVEHIKTRIKSKESAMNKLTSRGYELTCHNLVTHVHDMLGMRIVCSFLDDVYEVVNIIKSSKQFKIKDESDYIKEPKATGYISYHINVLVPIYLEDEREYVEAEIQIRTVAMDFWATVDHKLRYKLPTEIPADLENEMRNC